MCHKEAESLHGLLRMGYREGTREWAPSCQRAVHIDRRRTHCCAHPLQSPAVAGAPQLTLLSAAANPPGSCQYCTEIDAERRRGSAPKPPACNSPCSHIIAASGVGVGVAARERKGEGRVAARRKGRMCCVVYRPKMSLWRWGAMHALRTCSHLGGIGAVVHHLNDQSARVEPAAPRAPAHLDVFARSQVAELLAIILGELGEEHGASRHVEAHCKRFRGEEQLDEVLLFDHGRGSRARGDAKEMCVRDCVSRDRRAGRVRGAMSGRARWETIKDRGAASVAKRSKLIVDLSMGLLRELASTRSS